jgi:putative solute:sodium symporter small subunit
MLIFRIVLQARHKKTVHQAAAVWGGAACQPKTGTPRIYTAGCARIRLLKREGIRPMAQQTTSSTSANDQAHWKKTTNLMWIHLGIWFFFGYIIHMFAPALNKIVIAGFPLGFYMAAQGSLIAFVVQLFVFAKQQDKIDREFGVAEDD